MTLSSNYPPGVTGNEPQLTGVWPCIACGGEGAWLVDREGGRDVCPHCRGSGVEPEEFELTYTVSLVEDGCTDRDVVDAVLEAVRACSFYRSRPDDRAYLRAAARLRAWRRRLG